MGNLLASVARFMQGSPKLIGYRSGRAPAKNLFVYSSFYASLVLIAMIYGIMLVLLPLFLYVYLVIPLLLLFVVVIWVLPAGKRAPTRGLQFFFIALTIVSVAWPEYLAFYIPGLPWISFIRIASVPMSFLFLLCLKSPDFTAGLKQVWRSNSVMTRAFIVLQLVMLLTIFLSPSLAGSFNRTLNYLFVLSFAYLAALWFFSDEKRTARWEKLLIGIVLLQLVIGLAELWNGRLLWADNIPFFLKVDQATLDEVIAGTFREGKYRVTSTFSVSLCMAEFLALMTPFVLRRIFGSTSIAKMTGWAIVDLLIIVVINVTRSRLGIAGWLLAHIVFVFLWGMKRWRADRTDIVGPSIGLSFPAGALILLVGMFTIPAIRNRTIGGGSTGLSDEARRVQFELLWPKFFDNPFGYGTGQSGQTLGYFVPGGRLTVDSYIITLLLDWGLIGFVAFWVLLIAAAYLALKTYWNARGPGIDVALPIGVSLIVFGVIRTVLSQDDNLSLMFMMAGAAAALYARSNQGADAVVTVNPVATSGRLQAA